MVCFCVFGKVAKVLKMLVFPSFWAFVGWLILVYLGLEGLGVFVVLVFVFSFVHSGFVFVCFGFVFVCCWIVVGVVLVLVYFVFVFVFPFLFFLVCFFCLEGSRVR